MAEPEPVTPPQVDAFRAWTRPAGPRTARIDISGIAVECEGLPASLADRMAEAYAPYHSEITGIGRPLRVRIVQAPIDYFVPPGFVSGRETYRMHTALQEGIFRTVSYRLASWIDVARRDGVAALASGELDPALRAFENFLRSSVAWLAIDAGGFLLHSASIVRSGLCYLFYGPSGAGKSTLAAMSRQGQVISDDLTLLLQRSDGLVAAGGPFRGTYTGGAPVIGAYPVAGFYRLRKDARVRLSPDDGGCFADLMGNLPFVVDQLPAHSYLFDRLRTLVADIPFRYLHFNKNADFWPEIDRDALA